jgi:phosphoribosylamine--glycine ligase
MDGITKERPLGLSLYIFFRVYRYVANDCLHKGVGFTQQECHENEGFKAAMRVLIVSKECDSVGLAHRLVQEGNDVKFSVEEIHYDQVCKGFGVTKIKNWKDELPWVGKEGLIIFDYTGFGKTQDDLRAQGYCVVGGSEGGDRLELERDYAFDIMRELGIKTVPLHHLENVKEAIRFVEHHREPWVVKHNGCVDKTLTYVGRSKDGQDVIDLLRNYEKFNKEEMAHIILQKRIDGIEVAVGRYFNGTEWTGPIDLNIEHKALFPGGVGPMTGEMGTLMWHHDSRQNGLYHETLSRLGDYLKSTDFRGDIDVNCIVNEEGIFPLEVTARFGYPAIAVQLALSKSPFGEFLKSVGDGRKYAMDWRRGYGIVVQIAVPPFPYAAIHDRYSPEGLRIGFTEELSQEELDNLHFDEVGSAESKIGEREYRIAAKNGYVMCVTGVGRTIQEARNAAYKLVDKLIIPKMFYRNDIGLKFMEHDGAMLREWGYA